MLYAAHIYKAFLLTNKFSFSLQRLAVNTASVSGTDASVSGTDASVSGIDAFLF